jgi:GH18 family chitinase
MIYFNVTQAGISPSKIGVGIPFYGRIKRGCRSGYLSGSTCTQGVTELGQKYASGNALQNPRDPIDYRNLIKSVYWSSGTKVWDATDGAQYIRYDTGNSSQDAFVPYTGVEQISEAAK